ncbi:GDSL-type esterase/lipase family protein [Phenylobacterium aquaticum]|uniref:GDSL-type esterase/lipase family protein n=2 Tax=Phenylobacterium aquaticum TaxID=1763816 RepID=UPI0026EB037A|nr:GDSL-type esterase/lipase family protein [Phenylobacterium aquaticum]
MLRLPLAGALSTLALFVSTAALGQVPQASAAPPPMATPAAPSGVAPAVEPPIEAPAPAQPFAAEIAHFAELDATAPPQACAFLFVGSSTIRFWRSLDQDMSPYPVINRGFGGSKIEDVDLYFDKVVTPYKPRAIFFYAGENDLWSGETVEAVVANFERFMALKTAQLGEAPVYFISLKPSKLRLAQMPLQSEVNARIRALADTRADLRYVDVTPAMLDQGAPKDIYVADGLHMNPDGYALWTGVVRPVLEHEAQDGRACGEPTVATR